VGRGTSHPFRREALSVNPRGIVPIPKSVGPLKTSQPDILFLSSRFGDGLYTGIHLITAGLPRASPIHLLPINRPPAIWDAMPHKKTVRRPLAIVIQNRRSLIEPSSMKTVPEAKFQDIQMMAEFMAQGVIEGPE
jgi:hypothetical protein